VVLYVKGENMIKVLKKSLVMIIIIIIIVIFIIYTEERDISVCAEAVLYTAEEVKTIPEAREYCMYHGIITYY
jgi:hypothetical protein